MDSDTEEVHGAAVAGPNGLMMINGLSLTNGLSMYNGLSLNNGLSLTNGLSMTNGLMTTESGRKTVSYLVRCALPAGDYLDKQDQTGTTHRFYGGIGVAPQYKNGSCNEECQEWLSACMLAHVNAVGQNVPIWLVSSHSAIGWGRSPQYPNQEGTFMGNIFTLSSTVKKGNQAVVEAYYCEGPGFANGTVAGRLGDGSQSDVYTNAYGAAGSPPPKCNSRCAAADSPNSQDGYKQCGGLQPAGLTGNPRVGNRTITVWRPSTTSVATRYDFENDAQGWSPGSISTAQKASGSKSLATSVSATTTYSRVIPGNQPGIAGKTISMKVWVPSTGLQALSPYVKAGNYAWTSTWYDINALAKNAWNTISVTVPAGAVLPLLELGVVVQTTASATYYIDSVSW